MLRRPCLAVPGAKDVFKDQKEGGGGGGYYWPVPAVWRSGGADPEFHQNGVYLSHLAALVFSGKKIATKVPSCALNPTPHSCPRSSSVPQQSCQAALVVTGKSNCCWHRGIHGTVWVRKSARPPWLQLWAR